MSNKKTTTTTTTKRNRFMLDNNTVVTTRLSEQEFRERYEGRRRFSDFETADHLSRGRQGI
jgi:hypothetical protein